MVLIIFVLVKLGGNIDIREVIFIIGYIDRMVIRLFLYLMKIN